MEDAVVLVGATYHRDIERFALLRQSVERFAPQLVHRVAVHAEDMSLFERRFAGAHNLELVSTAELLPADLERYRRRRDRVARIRIAAQVVKRLPMGHFKGYLAQQLTKYELARRAGAAHVLVIDSDTILTRPITVPSLVPMLTSNGKPVCFSIPATAAAPLNEPWRDLWHANALAAVGVHEAPAIVPVTDALTVPSHTTSALLRRMIDHLEQLHGMDWRHALARKFQTFSEFMTHEKFCRFVLPAGEAAVAPPRDDWALSIFTGLQQEQIDRMLSDNTLGRHQFFLLHSKLKDFNYAGAFAMLKTHLEK